MEFKKLFFQGLEQSRSSASNAWKKHTPIFQCLENHSMTAQQSPLRVFAPLRSIWLLSAVVLAVCLPVSGKLTDKELKQFKSNVEIAGIRVSTWKNREREKSERMEINTFQSEDDPVDYDMSRFRMRMVVELTDRYKKTYLVRFTGAAPEDYDSEYQGEDYWILSMAYGRFERLKVSAYAIQFGIMDDETFVPLAEAEDHSEDMRERVRTRTTTLFPGKVYLRHYYMYDDSSEGVTESVPKNIRAIN